MTKIRFIRNGHETEVKDEIAEAYEKSGRAEIVKGKPGRKPKESKQETPKKSGE